MTSHEPLLSHEQLEKLTALWAKIPEGCGRLDVALVPSCREEIASPADKTKLREALERLIQEHGIPAEVFQVSILDGSTKTPPCSNTTNNQSYVLAYRAAS